MEFRLLGPLQVTNAGVEIEVSAGRHRALLAALLLRPNRAVTTDELVARVWDGDPPRDARSTAQTYVGRLRGTLGDGLIGTRSGGYLISVTAQQLDLIRFDDLLRCARQADQPGQEAALLEEALALWRGPALANVPSEALHRDEVPALTERRLRALERRLDLDLVAGEHGDLVAELQALVAAYPLRERFWAQLITALAGCGRPAEALQAYEELRARLAEELGADPSRQLQELHRSILRGEGPCVGSPGPASGSVRPAQLPADVAAFTGRAAALRRLDRFLPAGGDDRPAAVAICAIEGTAGIGKTALAVHWAHRVRDRFPDGQLYVNLRGYAGTAPVRPIEALAGMLHAMAVPVEQVPARLDEAAALYRSLLADRRMLVLLDNAAHPDQVRPLLPGGSGCLVLVTSRDRLAGLAARDGARRLVLDMLTPDDAHALLSRLLGAGRVRSEPAAAGELARLCGYLPLAVRIAAANLTAEPGYRLAGYVARLREADRMAVLTVPGDEQAAVPAAFDLSYRRRPDPARRLFRLLGLAPGPDLTTESAAALAGITVESVGQLLRTLAEAHLLERFTLDRYAFHDLLRAYAADRAHEEDDACERHAALGRLYDHYLDTADAAARLLYPHMCRLPQPPSSGQTPAPVTFADRAHAVAWLGAETANLVATLHHTAAHGPHPVAWRLGDALRAYFMWRAPTVDWQAAAGAALAAAEAAGDQNAQAVGYWSLAGLNWRQNDYPQAIAHAERALALTRRTGWVQGQASGLGNLGALYYEAGPLAKATEHLSEALALAERTGQPASPTVLGNLGLVCLHAGRLAEAADYAERALTVNAQVGSGNVETIVQGLLGEVHHAAGRLDLALDHVSRALTIARAVGNRISEGEMLAGLAERRTWTASSTRSPVTRRCRSPSGGPSPPTTRTPPRPAG